MPDVWACRGTVVQAPTFGTIELISDALLVVQEGRIVEIGSGQDQADTCARHGLSASSVLQLEVQLLRLPYLEALNPSVGEIIPAYFHAGWRVSVSRFHRSSLPCASGTNIWAVKPVLTRTDLTLCKRCNARAVHPPDP